MLTRLVARDFRNFTSLDVDVPSAGLVIVGENGHGKTNLLEAAAYLGLLRSIRGARDADLIRFGAAALHVRAELAAPTTVHQVAVGYERASRAKRVTLDGVETPKLSQALGALPSVGFAPADVALVTGGPGDRRRYLDVVLAMSSPVYLTALQQFRAALLRRNAVLRQAQRAGGRGTAFDEQASLWEPALARHGGMVMAMRQQFVGGHAERLSALAVAMGEREPVTMRYHTSGSLSGVSGGALPAGSDAGAMAVQLAASLAEAFQQQRAQELKRGTTLVGPHRDELHLLLGARDLRTFGSAGQQRSAAIALRLLELDTVRGASGRPPLLLLDDPFAELDLGRAARVLALLEAAGVGQVLLAVPRTEDIPSVFTRLERRTMYDGVLT